MWLEKVPGERQGRRGGSWLDGRSSEVGAEGAALDAGEGCVCLLNI
jgi:hypothetical protein